MAYLKSTGMGGARNRGLQFIQFTLLLVGRALTPSFLDVFWQDEDCSSEAWQPAAPARGRRTVYLDGLRGLAAFIVYIYHFLLPFDRSLELGYIPSNPYSSIFGLPIIGLFRSGSAVVFIFFVISGYVLSLPASRAIHNCDWDGVLRSLSAGSLKRGPRLFFPAASASMIIMLLVWAGLYTDEVVLASLPAHWPPLRPSRKTSLSAQVADWLGFVFGRLINPWQWESELFSDVAVSYYGAHLWTIQAEFHSSLILFFVIMALSRISRSKTRAILGMGIIIFSALWKRWDIALFLCGMGFAYLDVESPTENTTLSAPSPVTDLVYVWFWPRDRRTGYLVKAGRAAALLTGLWLGSYPESLGQEALGFRMIGAISSSAQLWQALGAWLIVGSIRSIRSAQVLLTTSPLQYLGKISFALYIVHEPILQAFGWAYAGMLRAYFIAASPRFGLSEDFGALVGIWLAFVSMSPLVVILADYAWRGLDNPFVALSREIGKRI